MASETQKKLPVADILKTSFAYFNSKPLAMTVFSVLNYIIVLGGVYTWSKPSFFVVMVFAYMFWSYFFRFYFDKKPYLQTKSMTSSLAPSVKILVTLFVVLTLLIVLPFMPLFLGFGGQEADAYLNFLKKYMQDSQTLDVVIGVVMIFAAPYFIYRPFFAWVGALLGRNGNIKFAMSRTRGNYWRFVMLLLILNLPFAVIEQIVKFCEFPQALALLLISPFIVYTNIVIARTYEFFFIED